MKRYGRLLFCMAMSLLVLAGCGSSSNNLKETDWEPTIYESVNTLDGVSMTIKEGTVSSTELTLILENNSDKQCIYGESYLLEKNIEGNWYQVPVTLDGEYGFVDIGYELNSSDVKEWPVDWAWLYGSLNKGHYRIVKDILDFREAGDYDHHYLTAEFIID
ncbi:immunoglobulin-like domain-containing protein [Halalkalibacter akibai]|uniref:Bacterial Ig-like domain-containing protein n=1 Tax=Halalkalibacter akibai (strain ATCC 43226 / DSM 21942 / CIP 109018 / JCM 9157 / 1139) TaxID=1236973 RepID=W4QZ71_HALA3|nr:immunoglobulin-like domain-containing protein [Halalkalibacter akibai]GAE37212.1 hypothetical protein JCM9157_4480 [Halalkalibacter akibai JCM 9157]